MSVRQRVGLLVVLASSLVAICAAGGATTRRATAPAADEDDRPLWHYDCIDEGGYCGFSPDGKRVVAVDGKAAIVFDTATGKALTPVMEHERGISIATFSADGERLVTGGWDEAARVWDARTGRRLLPPLRHEADVRSAVFSPDGKHILTAGGGRACLWDVASGRQLTSVTMGKSLWHAEYSRDGKRLLVLDFEGQTHLCDAETCKPILSVGLEHAHATTLSVDGKLILTGDQEKFDHVACVWDAKTGKLLARSPRHWGEITSVAFSGDGSRFATATDGSVRVWDTATGKPLSKEFGYFPSRMWVAALTPDGRRVLGAGEAGTAVVWDVASGEKLVIPRGKDFYPYAALSPDGRRYVTCGRADAPHSWSVSVWAVPPEKAK